MDELKARIEQLELEVKYLRSLLDQHGISFETLFSLESKQNRLKTSQGNRIIPYSVTPEMARFFYSMFKGRKDVYSKRANLKNGGAGYFPVCDNFWRYGLCPKRDGQKIKCGKCPNQHHTPLTITAIMEHLRGNKPDCTDVIGLYPLLTDDTCNFLVFDFDNHDGTYDDANTDNDWIEEVNALRLICTINHIDVLVERSRSGKGAHLWIFFESPIPAVTVRKFGFALLAKGAESVNMTSFRFYDRMLPLQDHIPEGGIGSLIALPLQGQAIQKGNSAFIDKDWNVYPDQWAVLKSVKKLTINEIEKIIQSSSEICDTFEISHNDENGIELDSLKTEKPWEKHSERFHADDLSGVMEITLANGIYIRKANLKPRIQNQIRRLAAYSNPMFFKNLALGYSTYKTPRIMYLGDETKEFIHIPRGCYDTLNKRLEATNIPYKITDCRQEGTPIRVEFKGTLYPEQMAACNKLLKYENGVLSAATAFGKTVVGGYLISVKKANALILVRNTEILKNWEEDLQKFLLINEEAPEYTTPTGRIKKRKSPVGKLQASHNSLTGIVDIAMITSLIKNGEVNQIVKNYGLVIMDECHHAGAETDEAVLREISSKYVYGLTATPKRDDGQEKKIFMQLGAIRFRYTAKDRAEKQGIGHLVYPRFTRLINVSNQKPSMVELNQLIIESEGRNELIVSDVVHCIELGRTPIIITKYKEHAARLHNLLTGKADYIFLLQGGRSTKERDRIRQEIAAVPSTKTIILVAIGKYIGEGFNYPRLDTLFLAMPIAWQGNVEQYAGRLNRDYDGKHDVIILDYIDAHVPVLERMYHKRMRAYKQIGFHICTDLKSTTSINNSIFDYLNYQDAYRHDLCNAKKEIVISSPGVGKSKSEQLISMVQKILVCGVHVSVLTLPYYVYPETFRPHISQILSSLEKAGIQVCQKPGCHEHFAVIDRTVVWYGSMNLISREREDDNLMRVTDARIAEELLEIGFEEKSPGENHTEKIDLCDDNNNQLSILDSFF